MHQSTPIPLCTEGARGEITVGNPVTFGEGERGELPLVIRWRKQRIAFLPLYPLHVPLRGTGA